ncbi:MAG: PqqD family peptide modification chaperone [Bdellovibrionaceae bacterium]|nr:PqqD family peptide modification chaperone [Pseudobdellovibrionaceae bacterium]
MPPSRPSSSSLSSSLASLALFTSPIVGGALKESGAYWVCEKTGTKFPLLDGVPWLTPDPQRAIADWQNRAEALIAHFADQIAIMKDDLSRCPSELGRQRIKKLRTLTIQHIEFLKDVLAPLKLKGKLNAPQAAAFGYRLPANQGLLGYFQNLIRDWSLETDENDAQWAALREAMNGLEQLGRLAVLGSGGSRLAYDLHQSGVSSETIALDINPVLFLTTRRILSGQAVSLVEFTVAPKNLEATAATRLCQVPEPVKPGFMQAFADCYHLPFTDESVDTVLTPWLIDILPQPLEVLVGEINRVLKPGGQWLNTGSLNFQLSDLTKCYSLEETREVIEGLGFRMEALVQSEIPYLRSELSAHGRLETVTTFRAKKVASRPTRPHPDSRSEWLRDTSMPIPASQVVQASRVIFDVQAYVLAQVDGSRSIDAIALLVSQRYGLAEDNAREAVANFLARNADDGRV